MMGKKVNYTLLTLAYICINVMPTCLACGHRTVTPTRTPPTITCPSVEAEYIASPRTTRARVNWAQPTVSDRDHARHLLKTKLLTAKKPNSYFGESENTVSYSVTDPTGLTDHCSFTFKVRVVRCQYMERPDNSFVRRQGLLYGHRVEFECYNGYHLVGKNSATCTITGQWSNKAPMCERKTCPNLPIDMPQVGVRIKGKYCDNGNKFGSTCYIHCADGFAPFSNWFTKCTDKATWSHGTLTCKDNTPPKFDNCPTTIHAVVDEGQKTAAVEWPKLNVTENAGPVKIIEEDHYGLTGGLFKVGVHIVRFHATDKANNSANPCTFVVKVKGVVCDPPWFPNEPHMDTDCLNFDEGQSCKLSCYKDIRLNGTKFYKCKRSPTDRNTGYWDYGQFEEPPRKHPHCDVKECDKLDAPVNGAIACSGWSLGSQCFFSCNEDYDVPYDNYPYPYLCDSRTGTWGDDRVPKCQEREPGEKYKMPAYFYFKGTCSERHDEIRKNFIQLSKGYDCPKAFCTVEHVTVRCGDEDDYVYDDELSFDRRKRSSRRRRPSRRRGYNMLKKRLRKKKRPAYNKQYIKFTVVIVVPPRRAISFSEAHNRNTEQLVRYATAIVRSPLRLQNGVIRGVRVRKLEAVPVCRPGRKIGYFKRNSCVPCLPGSYHNVTSDECVACRYGQFQAGRGKLKCDNCPVGQTTLTLGNIAQDACKVMCPPGEYSRNGVVPCVKCPRSRYQQHHGAQSCTQCPDGMTTEDDGANSSSLCIAYDLLMQGPLTVPIEGKVPVPICDFTFAVWLKLVDPEYGGIKFEVYHSYKDVAISLTVATDVTFSIERNEVDVVNPAGEKWLHVAAIWTEKTLQVYLDSKMVDKFGFDEAPLCPIPRGSVLRIAMRGQSFAFLRDLNLIRGAKPGLITQLFSTCDTYLEESHYSLEHIDTKSLSKVHEITPSTCLAHDVCENNPCGDSLCIPKAKSYTCVCRGGYSGEHCETPPEYCKDNICQNNSTCVVEGTRYTCSCLPGFRGQLCENKIADGAWGEWMDWGACPVSCGRGTRIRRRFCDNPPPDDGGMPCQGPQHQTQECATEQCPECDLSTLVIGKGIIPICKEVGTSIECKLKCQNGLVFPEKPFKYVCQLGQWIPTTQTVSCTEPVSPLTAGINYTAVFDNSVSSRWRLTSHLNTIGNSFSCARTGSCHITSGVHTCSERVKSCTDHNGTYYGSVIVERSVASGHLDVTAMQTNETAFRQLSPLFSTWTVFTHSSTELERVDHRELVLSLKHDKVEIHPYKKEHLKFEVPGQFGRILAAWKHLDDTNWEVRAGDYADFGIPMARGVAHEPNFLSARQMMTCPVGAVQGGLFCMKCPPGKYYENKACWRCPRGFFQDVAGQLSCEPCPGFQTTELMGSPSQEQCKNSSMSNLKLVLRTNSAGFSVLHLNTMILESISLDKAEGYVDHVAYSPRDGYLYYTTHDPPTIGRARLNGDSHEPLFTFTKDTTLTGLAVDEVTGLVFYTTYRGLLAALEPASAAEYVLLNNLTKPRGLLVDGQNFDIHWIESNKIQHLDYEHRVADVIHEDKYAVFSALVDQVEERIVWQSKTRLKSADRNGSNPQTIAAGITSLFGMAGEYYFYADGNAKLIRMNKDASSRIDIKQLPTSLAGLTLVNLTRNSTDDNPCIEDNGQCEQGCFPSNATYRQCFCARDFTLQKDKKSCRRDMSVTLVTDDPRHWSYPNSSDYSIPPSMTLRLKVKACHSARLALAETNQRLYKIFLGEKKGNDSEMSIKKCRAAIGCVHLVGKFVDALSCDDFRFFWITWQEKTLKVGKGRNVGQNMILRAADFRPFTIRYVMFGNAVNATATWQI